MTHAAAVLNTREAAAFLGVHPQTIRKLVRAGVLPGFKVGKDWRFHREALLQWIEGQRAVERSCSVLVVDDEVLICRVMARDLERDGCRVRSTTSAAEGLELVRQEPPDVILLDLQMPGMNGVQFLELLRRDHPDLPVVIVTGHPDGDLMLEAARHAPVMMLPKPVERQILRRTIEALVGPGARTRGAQPRSSTE